MIKELFTIVKTKVWFATVNRYKLYKAKQALAAYEKKLSPKNREYAEKVRKSLSNTTPGQAIQILRAETSRLNEQQFRLIEKIDRVHG